MQGSEAIIREISAHPYACEDYGDEDQNKIGVSKGQSDEVQVPKGHGVYVISITMGEIKICSESCSISHAVTCRFIPLKDVRTAATLHFPATKKQKA